MAGRSPTPSARCSIRSSRCAAACGFRRARRCASRSGRSSRRSRDDVLDLVDKHRDANAFERAATLAWTQAQVQLRHLGHRRRTRRACSSVSPATCSTPTRRCGLRPTRSAAAAADRRRSGRRAFPATCRSCCVRIDDVEDIGIVRQLLRAHEYWRMKQLAVDLVILNERASSYVQDLQTALETRRADEPVTAVTQRTADRAPGSRVRAARRSDLRRRREPAVCRRRGRVLVGPPRQCSRSSSTASQDANAAAAPPARRAPQQAHQRAAPRRRSSSSSTASAASPRRTRIRDDPRRGRRPRRRRGSMSSPILRSASRSPSRAAATPGRSTAARTSSRRGRTIR